MTMGDHNIKHVNPLSPHDALKHHFTSLKNSLNFPTTKGYRTKISMKLVYQYMAIFCNFPPTSNHLHPLVSIVGSLRDREVACSASDRQGSNFESCVWRTVSSQSSHHPQEVLLAQFSLYVHKGGLKPDSFHFIHYKSRWDESGFRPPLCTYRLNWARRTSWGWWDD